MTSQGIYAIENIVTSRRYVGSSQDIDRRYKDHVYLLLKGRHPNVWLQRAWTKHGAASFRLVILETIEDVEDLLITEQGYLDSGVHYYITGEYLYNLAPYADRPTMSGKQHSVETKAKIGAANSIALLGRTVPASVIAKRVAKVRGQKRSPETRAKISAGQKRRGERPEVIAAREIRRRSARDEKNVRQQKRRAALKAERQRRIRVILEEFDNENGG